ncbi:arylamine N-acetyltransferase [Chelativorans sp. AA-79]|uniref:arylamine N-acetyltransferase family protein n=1 Tax=Chelativorans sp. AA-79 TaxID=3028735 RepID=UPI0023F70193|nr:arylamine N-acetyltransferase [Chelativorans sp. AA-79]WEX07416.1 arylamine N-acetyltransferase [Chelativorans sp. AA-79]
MGEGPETFDLDAYFRRIGYDGPRAPTLETLSALHLLHPLAIPFENLDPLMHRPVRLDLAGLQEKLVRSRRGGYCFEHNRVFMAALDALGFSVSGLGARVLWGRADDAITPRSHMLLRVEMPEGTYLADVGFGGLTLTAPLRLEAGCEQRTPHETFRLEHEGGMWRLRAKVGEEWRSLFRFGLEEQLDVDYEVTSYFTSTNPGSPFRRTLAVARPAREGRRTLQNRRFRFRRSDGSEDVRELTSAADIETVLREAFGIDVPDSAAFAAALRREAII